MAEPQVTSLRSIEYNVPDLAKTSRFYELCWGLKKSPKKMAQITSGPLVLSTTLLFCMKAVRRVSTV